MPEGQRTVAVVGGGLSGLAAARKLADAGYDVHLFEANKERVGGKIHTTALRDQVTDHGAEFIDSDQYPLINLCQSLGVKLIPSQDDSIRVDRYCLPNGQVLPAEKFNEAFAPVWDRILGDLKTVSADPMGARAQAIDTMSLPQYLSALNRDERPLWQRTLFFWQKPQGVDPNIIAMVEQCFASERGRPASQFSALQFVYEVGRDKTQSVIDSDCQWRVEGGTQVLIDALHKDLQSKGVHFHMGAAVTDVSRQQDGKIAIKFDGASEPQQFDQAIFAASAHQLANVNGLDALGLSAEDRDTLQIGQYSHFTKITIMTKQPIANDGYFYSSEGYQTWNRAPGAVVFLVGADLSSRYKGKELLNHVLEDYAHAHHTTVDQLFDLNHVDFNAPNVRMPCCASPGVGQSLKYLQLRQSFDKMAEEEGVGFVGTYIPGNKGVNGYMGHGIESVDRAVDRLVEAAAHKDMTQALVRANSKQAGLSFTEREAVREQSATGMAR